ncbi:MAG: aromatic amino acid lyase [Chthonomonadaceae bacterium]|nr:aromatic amino acid lyase [Chthonomonadaceae bacterium]
MAQDGHDTIHVDQAFTIETLVRAAGGATLTVSKETLDRLDAIRASLVSEMADNERRVYGFNTGFGDNRNRPTVPIALTGVIQDNLILSHASGYGPNLEGEVVRAAMALRAHSLALGHSGIRGRLVDALCGLANSGFLPVVPRFGSVGASGDLAPLSHVPSLNEQGASHNQWPDRGSRSRPPGTMGSASLSPVRRVSRHRGP